MIDVEAALNIVLQNAEPFGMDKVFLSQAIGCVLAEDIRAGRCVPPFDRVCMDGIAIDYSAYKNGQRTFKVEGVGAAGYPQQTLSDRLCCMEIMTGAPLPTGTDTVIRYEDLEPINGKFKILTDITAQANIHFKGSDHNENDVLLSKGTIIKAIDVNVLATEGKHEPKVYRKPDVAVISSGEELVPVTDKPLPHQIRRSNVHMLAARLHQLGVTTQAYHLKDDPANIVKQVGRIVDKHDVLMMSGGVSKGKFDFIPDVLSEMKFDKLFHRIAQRPGKPFWFGRRDKKIVFAFPGNPVSTLACFHKYFVPWYRKCTHQTSRPKIFAALSEDVAFKPDLTYFAQAKLCFGKDAKIYAQVVHGNGSGDMVSPTLMDGFLELPPGRTLYKAGETFNFIPFHPIIN